MTEQEKITQASKSKAGKYLTFQLGDESYGLEIMKAQEIIGMMHVTRVPRTPAFVRGVVNLRGKVIPVIDLRRKFGLEPKADTDRTCIIVSQIVREDHHVIMGLIVDEVSEVLDILAEQIDVSPDFGSAVDTSFLLGMGKVGARVIMLLDVDKVFSVDDVASVAQMRKQDEEQQNAAATAAAREGGTA
ncbi:MAG: purine-binding chemotaxis protein CheW [Kiritimatiellae bacterium]|nr:purine-binding chemotaxis protein CheW [Kiritimatiellia bacterium]